MSGSQVYALFITDDKRLEFVIAQSADEALKNRKGVVLFDVPTQKYLESERTYQNLAKRFQVIDMTDPGSSLAAKLREYLDSEGKS